MKIKLITHASTQNHSGFQMFAKSMTKFNYDWTILNDPEFDWAIGAYKPFYKWCKNNSEGYTHMLLHDSFDAVAIAPMSEIYEKYKETNKALISCEKNCFPVPELASEYPLCETPHKFVNGGAFIFPIPMFIKLFEENPMGTVNAQEWLTRLFLANQDKILLDTKCEIFQSISFLDKSDFALTMDGRLINRYTESLPILLHANGGQNCVPHWAQMLLDDDYIESFSRNILKK